MLVDRGGFWYRVLVARYDEVAEWLEGGGRSASSWWRELVKIRDGVDGVDGGWFGERVSKVLGDGNNMLFWYNNWLGDVPLCKRYGRLFDLATNKFSTVVDMCARGWEDGGEAWSWRRRLWTWEEEMLDKCRQLLDGVFV